MKQEQAPLGFEPEGQHVTHIAIVLTEGQKRATNVALIGTEFSIRQ